MIIFLVSAFLVLLSSSNLWFLGAALICIIFIGFRFFRTSINQERTRSNELVLSTNQLQIQLESLMEKESKAREDMAQMEHAKAKMLSSMSHEIRTPMNGVIGMASLLAETTLNEEQREYIETILGCSKSLLTRVNDILINDLLDFSKVESNNGELEQKKFNLCNCIEEVLEMFAGKAAETSVDLIYQLDTDVPLQVVGDSKRLSQVLINLVENAFESTKQGEIFVKVHLLPNE
ncbi:MAG: histidine kinase dimerization/phospho-acceptor domain-containing protein, partial [Ginsengibacter sp.]